MKIETRPFYAIETKPVIVGTYCGIKIDKEAHVMNIWGRRIPRLYAAGEVTGGFHGDGYMGGTALGKAVVFGRIAGRNGASEKSQKKH
jgi:fumarate reductase flavoprotein subunit